MKGLDLSEDLAQETGTVKAQRDLSISYERLGDISRKEGNLAKAKEWYLKGLELCEELSHDTGAAEDYNGYALFCYRMGTLDSSHYDISMLKRAETIWSQLVEYYPQVTRYAENLQEVQELLKKLGKQG